MQHVKRFFVACFPEINETTMQQTAHYIFKRTLTLDDACVLDMPRGMQPCNDEGCICHNVCMQEHGKSGQIRLVLDIKTKASTGTRAFWSWLRQKARHG